MLEAVLARTAEYVTEYQTKLAGIVAEEKYTQDVRNLGSAPDLLAAPTPHREMRSDLLLVRPSGEGPWLQFRDVFELDGKPLRDRDERLLKLFVDTKADARAQAATIANEGARYNIGPVTRTINVPVLALIFVSADNQPRSRFLRVSPGNLKRFAGVEVTGGDLGDRVQRSRRRTRWSAAAAIATCRRAGACGWRPTTGRVLRTEAHRRGHAGQGASRRDVRPAGRTEPARPHRDARELHVRDCATRASSARPPTAASGNSRSPPRRRPSRHPVRHGDGPSGTARRLRGDVADLSGRGRGGGDTYVFDPATSREEALAYFLGPNMVSSRRRNPAFASRLRRGRRRGGGHVQAHSQSPRPRLARRQRVVHGRSRRARQGRRPRPGRALPRRSPPRPATRRCSSTSW